MEKCISLGIKPLESCVIYNAPDKNLFNINNVIKNNKKIKILISSWSDNLNKGFRELEKLDSIFDFDTYEIIFAGNTKSKFKNIKNIGPIDIVKMSKLYKEVDVYLSASKIEACSNSLLESLHCGTPVIAPKASSNIEIINKFGGLLYENIEEIPLLIKKLIKDENIYKKNINILRNIDEVAKDYTYFCKKCKLKSKKISILRFMYIYLMVKIYKSLMLIVNLPK